MNDSYDHNPQESPTSEGADSQAQGGASSSQPRKEMRYGWLKPVIKPALFLAAGALFVVGLAVYANKLSDRPAVYQGTIETNKLLDHAKIPAVARLQPQRFPRQRPADYEMWTTESGRLRRVRTVDLPLRVYSNDRSQKRLVERAITVWNQAGATVGMSREFFREVDDPGKADFTIDWSGRGLPDNAAGIARLGSGSVIRGIALRKNAADTKLAEVLLQELGHILGLEHSGNRDDIMAPTVHAHRHASIAYVELTTRDVSALWWLYNQTDYVAIVPLRSVRR